MDTERVALVLAVALLTVSMAFAAQINPRVETLSYTCTYEGGCTTTQDETQGVCRWLTFDTADGEIRVQACGRDDGRYEVYRQAYPTGHDFQVCVGGGCVDELKGYDSFTSAVLPPTDDGYIYEDPSVFGTSCSLDGDACTKLSDVTSGTCRTVLYDTTGDDEEDLGLLLCHKEDSRYELYRVFYPEGDLYATMGPGFVDELKGYDSFVLTAPITPVIPPGNETNETPVCLDTSVADVDVTCDGNITSDEFNGACRYVTCASTDGDLAVLACDKPDAGEKTYFEMYRTSFSGEPLTICLDGTCLDGDLRGFSRSEGFCS